MNTPEDDAAPIRTPLLAALAAGIGASLCCVMPLVLALLGIGGAWVSHLTALEPYRPLFVTAALAAIAFGAWRVHRPLADCAPGDACAVPRTRRRQQILFWALSALVLLLLASPYLIARIAL